MAHIKKSEIRYRVIDNCLHRGAVEREKKGYSSITTKYILDKVNEKLLEEEYPEIKAYNTIRNDILSMQTANPDIEIVRDDNHKEGGFSYATTDMSFYALPLRENEVVMLTQTIASLSRFDGMPQADWISSLAQRLRLTLDLESDMTQVVCFDQNKYLKGLEFFGPLLSAITKKEVLLLSYSNFKKKVTEKFIIHPYYLKEYNNRWFLIANNDLREDLSNYALDRIVNIEVCRDKKIKFRNHEYDFNDDYFTDMVGVSRNPGQSPEEVTIEISPEILPYIRTKPLHESQRLKTVEKGGAIVTLNVIINFELEKLLLSYCDDLKVISPPSLANKIRARLEKACNNYYG